MKKILLCAVASTAMFTLASCVSEDINPAQQKAAGEYGYINLNVTNDQEFMTRANADNTWTLKLGGKATKTLTVGTLSQESLEAGDYTVEVYNYETEALALAANENYGAAWYTGDLGITDTSKKVTVTKGETTNATLEMGKAKNVKFKLESSVPASAAVNITVTGNSSSRALTFNKAANGEFNHTEAFFSANEQVTIGLTYNSVELGASVTKTLSMAGAGTENKLVLSTNDNGKISLTITYDETFSEGNTISYEFDAATGNVTKVNGAAL